MDKPFIAYAGIDKITIGNGRNDKAYDVSVALAAAAPALLEALEMMFANEDAALHGRRLVHPHKVTMDKARAAIAQAKGESNG